MQRRAGLFDMGADIVEIEIAEPLPETCSVGLTYKIEGTVKVAGIGAPPWVYAEVRKKEWYKPGVVEEVSYERGLPKPISGEFSIDLRFKDTGNYEVTIVATPAPLSLPVVGVEPIIGKSDTMEIEVAEAPPAAFRFSAVTIDGNPIALTNHDADAGLLLEKTTADYLDITPAYEWTGPRRTATISIKAGYRDLTLGFSPKTGAYTRSVTLPESPYTPYEGELTPPIRIPLTACGGLTDGAIEVVLKIAGEPDYISRIWNVYATKPPEVKRLFDILSVIVNDRSTTNKVTDTDFDFETPTPMTTSDKLAVNFEFQWIGPARTVEVSIRAGHKGIVPWDFVEKTPYYTATVDLPEASEVEPFTGTLSPPIEIPLTACGGLTDGAIEIKVGDYISQIWNVYATKVEVEERWAYIEEYTTGGHVASSPLPNRKEDAKWYYDYGVRVTLAAIPDSGYKFARWSSLSEVENRNINPTYMTMTENRGSSIRKIVPEFEIEAVAEAPIITTLPAINITHNSATLKASLVRKGLCGVIGCYIEWGTTTAYGYKSPEIGMEVGYELVVDIASLTPNTTYHFRAVAAGRCVTPPLIGYGSDMTFTTSAEVVKGFTMRVINPPAGATHWIAGAVAGGTLPHMVNRIGIYETWVWDKDVPDYAINFHLMVVDAVGHSLHSMEWDYFLLRDGKDYVYNCATWEMIET